MELFEDAMRSRFALYGDQATLDAVSSLSLETNLCCSLSQLKALLCQPHQYTPVFVSLPLWKYARQLDQMESALYLPHDTGRLYHGLLHLRQAGYDLGRLSIDWPDESQCRRVMESIDYSVPAAQMTSFQNLEQFDAVLSQHIKNFDAGRVDNVLTGEYLIFEALRKRGVPCWYPVVDAEQVQLFLQATVGQARFLDDERYRTAAVIIHLSTYSNLERGMEFFLQENQLHVQKALLQFARELDGHCVSLGAEDYLLLTTKALFKQFTKAYTTCPLLEHLEEIIHAPVQIGAGIGLTVQQSVQYAQLGLKYSLERETATCYIIPESQELIGPIVLGREIKQNFRVNTPALEHFARAQNIPVDSLHRFFSYIRKTGQTTFSVKEISPHLGISARTVYRLVTRLVACGYIADLGESKTHRRGRSSHFYRVIKTI